MVETIEEPEKETEKEEPEKPTEPEEVAEDASSETKEEDSSENLVSRAEKAAKEMNETLKSVTEERKKIEKLQAENIVKGIALVGGKKPEEDPIEYSKRVLLGEINLLEDAK